MANKKRVVVVDDKDRDRRYLTYLAEEAGCDVVGEGKDGEEGLKLAQELQPDLVLTDYNMPKGGGSSIAWKITTIPVIIVSTDMEPSWKQLAEVIGPHVTMLDKDDGDTIVAAIREVLGDEN